MISTLVNRCAIYADLGVSARSRFLESIVYLGHRFPEQSKKTGWRPTDEVLPVQFYYDNA